MIAATIANINRTKKQQKAFEPTDFFAPRVQEKPRVMSVDQSLNFIRQLNRQLGGVDLH